MPLTRIKLSPEPDCPEQWLDLAAQRWSGRLALSNPGSQLSFSQLLTDTADLARRHFPLPGPAALHAETRWDLALRIHAALRCAIPALPLEPDWPSARRQALVTQCGIVPPPSPETAQTAQDKPGTSSDSRRPDLLIPSSGSSGPPRIAMLSGANLRAAVQASAQRLPLFTDDLWLSCLPLGHIGGLSILLRCVHAGAGVRIHEGFEAELVWRELHTHPVTHISLVPAMLQRLLDASENRTPPSRLRVVLVGGAALDPGLARRALDAGWPLYVTYGMSETSSQVATGRVPETGLEAGWVGRPLKGFEVRIDDPDTHGVGRIMLRGPAVMAGYANPGLKPGEGLEAGWLPSGDLGRLSQDGELVVLGRADDILVSGGMLVHPTEVEHRLQGCPGIGVVALSARTDPTWGDLLVAVYTGPIEPAVLRAYCRQNLESECRPRRFLRREQLPLGASGKLDRRRLRQWVEERLR